MDDRFRIIVITVTAFICIGVVGYFGYLHADRRMAYSRLEKEVAGIAGEFPGDVGICIKDLRTGAEIRYNDEELFPSASIVKIPIMAAVFHAVDEGKVSLEDEIKLKWTHKCGGSGRLKNHRSGGRYSVKRLLELMVTESDNTATNMLTEMLGYDYLNELLEEKLGMSCTRMNRPIMDLRARRRGVENYTSASEIAGLLEDIYHGRVIDREQSFRMLDILLRVKSKDRIPRLLPESLPVAHKTGFMRGTCHDAGIIFTAKGDFVVCVLTSDVKSIKMAKTFIGDIAYRAYQYY